MSQTSIIKPSEKMPYWALALVTLYAVIFWVWSMEAYGIWDVGDHQSYLTAADRLGKLHTDSLRPPVYPAFILFFTSLFGFKSGLIILTALQWIVWIYAMSLLWRVCRMMGICRWLTVVVLVLVIFPEDVSYFNSSVIPESFSISGLIMLVYLALSYIHRATMLRVLIICALTIVMIFLKPVFIVLIPIVAVFFIARSRYIKRLQLAVGLAGMVAACCMVYAYMSWMEYSYGFFRMSEAQLHNDYHMLRRNRLIDLDSLPEGIQLALQKRFEKNPGIDHPDRVESMYYNEWLNTFQLNHLVTTQTAAHRDRIPGIILGRVIYTLDYSLYWEVYRTIPGEQNDLYYDDLYLPFWFALLVFAAYMAMGIRRWYKTRRFPADLYMPAALWAALYVSSIVGAQDEWGRLMAPVLSCMWLMLAWIIQSGANHYKLSEKIGKLCRKNA